MKFGVVIFPGSNCDRDMIHVLQNIMKQKVEVLWHKDHDLKNSAKTRNYQLVILVFVIVSLLMIVFTPAEMLFRFSILCIPLSIIIAYYFLSTKKAWLTEPLLYLLILFIILNYISIK